MTGFGLEAKGKVEAGFDLRLKGPDHEVAQTQIILL